MQRLLLLPLIAPLAAALIVAVANPRPATSLRLLTWRSPSLPLGAWIAAAAAAGALLSGSATALALRSAGPGVRRQVRRERGRSEPASSGWRPPPPAGDWGEPRRPDRPPEPAPPERAPGEPPPTMSVPFRVIRRPAATTATAASTASHARGGPRYAADEPRHPVSGEDDWDQPDSSEDW